MSDTKSSISPISELFELIGKNDPDFLNKLETLPGIVSGWVQPRLDIASATILDFGCGEGETALGFALRYPKSKVVGVDLTPNEAGLRSRFERAAPGFEFPENLTIQKVRPGEFAEEDAPYDLIYSWSVIEHIDQKILDKTIEKLKSMLSDSGWIFTQIAPLYYSAYGHHVAWEESFAWAHLTDQADEFKYKASSFSKSEPLFNELVSCYETLNKLTAEELKDKFEEHGFFIDAQFRTTFSEAIPSSLRYAFRRDVVETEQVVFLTRKADNTQRVAKERLKPHEFEPVCKALHSGAVEAMGNWWSDLPDQDLGVGRNLFERSEETRRCIELCGGVNDFSVFEVGPRDGYHTYGLEKAGAQVVAVEFNFDNYLRCIQVRNQYDLKSKFLYGDAEHALRAIDKWFDLIFLSGVVYHFRDPAQLLTEMLEKTDRVFIWTHVYDEILIDANDTPRGDGKFLRDMHGETFEREFRGENYTYHRLRYEASSLDMKDFSGGVDDYSVWLSREDLYRVVENAGFEIFGLSEFDHRAGPAVQFVAKRKHTGRSESKPKNSMYAAPKSKT